MHVIGSAAPLALLSFFAGAALSAQSIDETVRSLEDGQVRLSFAARDGVCRDDEPISTGHRRRTADWEGQCDDGPVRVALTVRDGAVADIDLYVGGRWRERAGAVRDLGTVAVDAASDFLLRLAEVRGGDLGPDAIGSAALADSVVVWPRLLGIARDTGADRETRKAAVFWLSMRAGERATEGLTEIASDRDDDREVREVALFSLSRLPGEEGVTALLQVARTSDDPDLTRHAIFWLGQSEDPRALDFLVEVLER